MSSDLELEVRQATPDEIRSYIVPAWLSSYALGFVGKHMRADGRYGAGREAYWAAQTAKVQNILSTSTVSVRVATYDSEPVAWICDDQSRRRVHYVFVNRNFRKQGIAKLLVPEWVSDASQGPVYFTHLPPPWYSRADAKDASKRPPWREHQCIDLISFG